VAPAEQGGGRFGGLSPPRARAGTRAGRPSDGYADARALRGARVGAPDRVDARVRAEEVCARGFWGQGATGGGGGGGWSRRTRREGGGGRGTRKRRVVTTSPSSSTRGPKTRMKTMARRRKQQLGVPWSPPKAGSSSSSRSSPRTPHSSHRHSKTTLVDAIRRAHDRGALMLRKVDLLAMPEAEREAVERMLRSRWKWK
jgi:hypothetical protein